MWDNLKASIASVVRTNNNQEITGANLQSVLNTIVNTVGANATFAGIAVPSTNPGTPDGPVFYIACEPGIYSNFNLTLVNGLYILENKTGSWVGTLINTGAAFEALIGYYNAVLNGASITVPDATTYRLTVGGDFKLKMLAPGTTATTLTIGNATNIPIWYNGAAVSAQNTWEAGEIISVFYDGTRFMASNSQGGSKFATNEKVKEVSIFGSSSQLNGKTDEQKGKMLPSGKVIDNIEQIIGTATYDTKLISNDFTTNGNYKIDGNSLVFTSSENWKCKIVSIEELFNTNAVGVVSTWASISGVSNTPPIIYLSGSSPIWSNYVGHEYGTGSVGTSPSANAFRRLERINIPLGATYAIINNLMTFGADSTVTYKSGISIRDDVNRLEDEVENIQDIIGTATYDTKLIVNDFTTDGYYKIDGNSFVFASSENWKCKIVSIDELYNTNAAGVAEDKVQAANSDTPPIIYLSGSSPVWSNFIGKQYGTIATTNAYFKKLATLNIPSGATHAIINNNNIYGSDSEITYQTGTSIKDNIQKLENRYVLVDKNGNGDFTTISSAINGTNDGDIIIVNSGTYEEDVHMWGKTRHIVGVSRETCILTNGTGAYATPPLEANIGSIENMTIIADNYAPTISDPSQNQVLASYGIHIEYNNATPYSFTIRNCKIVSKWSAGLGIGLRYNQTIIIEDCDLISECERIYSSYAGHWVEMGGLFFHNDNTTNTVGTGILRVKNTRLQGKKAALTMEAVNKTPFVDAEFDCNTFISEDYGVGEGIIYRYDNMVTQEGYLCGNKITLGIASHGNNIEELNA